MQAGVGVNPGFSNVMACHKILDIYNATCQLKETDYPQGVEYELVDELPKGCAQQRDPAYDRIYVSEAGDVYYMIAMIKDMDYIRRPLFAKLKPSVGPEGVLYVYLPKKLSIGKHVEVARLVMRCFGRTIHYTQMPVHIDGNLQNCALSNLKAPTSITEHRQSEKGALTLSNKRNAKITLPVVIGLRFLHHTYNIPVKDLTKAVKDAHISYASVYGVVTGRTWGDVLPLNPPREEWEKVKHLFADEYQNYDGWRGLD